MVWADEGTPAEAASRARSPAPAWAGYAACAWAFVFAAVSFYWAAGGTVGRDTLSNDLQERAQDPDPRFLALVWATGGLKVLLGLLALALVRPWGRRMPRWMLRTAAWGAGALMVLYGGANLVQFGLMEAGVIGIPESIGPTAVRWYLLLWEPWWLLGGMLFGAAAWSYRRRS